MFEKKIIIKFTKYILPYIKEEILLFFLMIIASIGSLATPYFLKIIIDDIFPNGNIKELINLLLLLTGVYILRIISSLLSDIIYTKVSEKIMADIRADIFTNILHKNMTFFKNSKVGELVFTLMNDVENIQDALSSLILRFINNIILVAGVITMLFILNYQLTLISLLFIPLLLFSIKKFTPHIQNSFEKIQITEGDLYDYLVERFQNIRVIKSYNTIEYERKKINNKQYNLINAQVKNTLFSSLNSNISTFMIALVPLLVLMYGGKQVFDKSMTLGALIAFIQYLNRLFNPTINLVNSYNQFARSFVSMKRVALYINKQIPSPSPKTIAEKINLNSIRLVNVSVKHQDHIILENINMTLSSGKTYAIHGPSGSGKSTIVNLLCNFITPTIGTIFINNKELSSITNWESHYSLIEKENQLFHDKLTYNLSYGNFENKLALDYLLKMVELEEIIKKLPNKEHTVLSHTGSNFSDGQKQRISIARAIHKSPDLFIFDEATSSLDVLLEKKILERIRNAFPYAIIILISHRNKTLSLADYLIEINNGKIINNTAYNKEAFF